MLVSLKDLISSGLFKCLEKYLMDFRSTVKGVLLCSVSFTQCSSEECMVRYALMRTYRHVSVEIMVLEKDFLHGLI